MKQSLSVVGWSSLMLLLMSSSASAQASVSSYPLNKMPVMQHTAQQPQKEFSQQQQAKEQAKDANHDVTKLDNCSTRNIV
ncbi:hypothetical protein [Paenibacillus sp. 481]|uniref:hypothetical protein n=1 Tax=Paenibacillus sp. 481 TaxID=2835869 RepID=UPI001E290DAB|nr:hypothetical protein [Paenibacillus sp. 481]UHA75266.1 hypothetical protein KIK04_09785 [Paenibacillus sp. 481]